MISIHAGVADRGLQLDLDAPSGAVTAISGPNGAGKSTLLHLVAGLVRPSSGSVRLDEREVAGPAGFVAPHRRRVALLTQRAALFPHLDVLGNVAFGPRAAGLDRAEAVRRARQELAGVGCAELAHRRPDALSGGQAQRVAIARALATDPDVVLLDEPLAGLDVAAAAEVRHTLASRLRGRTALLVTHEVLDIWTIADRLAIVEAGEVVETGPSAEVLTRPTSAFAAQLGGTNLFRGTGRDRDRLELAGGLVLHGISDPDQPLLGGAPGLASIAPDAISLHLEEPGGSPRNAFAAEVASVVPRGDVVRVQLVTSGQPFAADLTPAAVAELGLRPGLTVRAVVKATQVRLYGR